ncbi:GNAT family N-acetyltransferase [Ningiella sp. W23]|uniref:GNAT family N-acetyltransferase n=1 Tax=Ningiella sp. W23 TaxID=3023715 RepID=UPI0037567F88
MKIRSATLSDLPTLRAYLQGIVEAERPMDECLKNGHIEYYDPSSFIENENANLIVAEINGHLLGCGAGVIRPSKDYYKHDQHLYLAMMYVEAEHRGKGINAKIIKALIAWARDKGVENCVLTVYPSNSGAIKAYEKLGFETALLEMRLRP